MQSSLRTFLSTIEGPRILSSESTLSGAIQHAEAFHPDLVIVDIDILAEKANDIAVYEEYDRLCQKISPRAKTLILVNTVTQLQYALQVGADAALLKGELNDQFRAAILQLTPDEKRSSGENRSVADQPCG